VGSAKADLLDFPESVKDGIGIALSVAQFGGKHPRAKPWKGEGPGVLDELIGKRLRAAQEDYETRFAKKK
jgi:phage-related protein